MNIRIQYLLNVGILERPLPILTSDPLVISDRFLNLFVKHYYLDRNENINAGLLYAYKRILKTQENNDEDLQILKEYCKKYFSSCGIV